MVSILPSQRSGLDVLGAYLGQGASAAMPQMYENQKFQRGMSAIDQLQSAMQPNAQGQVDYGQMLANIARAVAANPGLERSGLVEHALKRAQAIDASKLPVPGGGANRAQEFIQENPVAKRGPEVNFLNQSNQNFPDVVGPQERTGNAPQEVTEGEIIPLRNTNKIRSDSIKRHQASIGTANPLTLREAYEDEIEEERQKERYNEKVESDRLKRKNSQKEYGAEAAKILADKYPEASPRMLAMASKWGEDTSLKGKSEAEIKEHVIEKANKFANTIDNIKRSMSRPNAINNIERGAEGSYKSFDQSAQDLRTQLKPLLDMGLYDEARRLLGDLNYGPEEREMIIQPLSEIGQTALNSIPSMTGTKQYRKFAKMPQGDINDLKLALVDLKRVDPNFSPLLARKYVEDRGYDWRLFKDAWNQLLQENEQLPPEEQMFSMTADQRQMSGKLDTPPLVGLYKILNSISPELQGR